MASLLSQLEKRIPKCTKCSRLIPYCQEVARVKRRQYLSDTYWGKPVPGVGDPKAEILLVGLAPGAHGANRTGRMFTGDSSGDWVYSALFKFQMASQKESTHRTDGMRLSNVYITGINRCAPPGNKPTLEEMNLCRPYVEEEIRYLKKLKVIIVLGNIAHTNTIKILKQLGWELPKTPKFGHGLKYKVGPYLLICSYHPSRQNTQTKRLTTTMWHSIFRKAVNYLEKSPH